MSNTKELSHYIDGQWVAGSSGSDSLNPSDTRDIVAKVPGGDKNTVNAAVAAAKAAFPAWANASPEVRSDLLDKVGSLIGGMTYGAKKDIGLKLFQDALKINPGSAIGMIEYANGLVMLEGDKRMKEATKLYEQAASSKALDAMERLDVELAKVELDE